MSQQTVAAKGSGSASTESAVDIRRIWNGPTTLGECPLWNGHNQRLLWIDSLGRKIWQADAVGQNARHWEISNIIGSIGLSGGNRLIAGLEDGFAFIDLSEATAQVEWIGNPEPQISDTRLNDGKVDRQGRFWCGSMNRDFSQSNASLYRLDPDLTWHQADTGFTVSNGIAFSLDGKKLYFSDSRVDRSYCYDLDPATGAISNRLEFVNTGAYKGRIDGATVDENGNYWGALFDGGAVACFSPEGQLLRHISLPTNYPTMCAFGGAELDILYVTSATFSMSEKERENAPVAGALFAIHGLGIRGVLEPEFNVK